MKKYFPILRISKLLLTFILWSYAVNSSADNFLIVSEKQHRFHSGIAINIESELISNDHKVDSLPISNINKESLSDYNIIITIGYKAAASLINNATRTSVLSLLIPKQAYNSILKSNVDKKNQHYFSSIYIDQPIQRQIQLIKSLSNRFETIGVIYGKNSYSKKNTITRAINREKLAVKNTTVLDSSELITETRHISRQTDILLAIPDSSIYNRRSIKGILLTTYRNQIPVLGFSKAYVKAGALAAVYSTPENISMQAIELLDKQKENDYQLTERLFPKYFEIDTNKKVAHSLNLNIDSKNQLLKYLRESDNNE